MSRKLQVNLAHLQYYLIIHPSTPWSSPSPSLFLDHYFTYLTVLPPHWTEAADADQRRRLGMSSAPHDSKSEPTTPGGSKKHAHFDDARLEEHYPLRRTITAPSSLERLPTIFFAASETHDLTPFPSVEAEDYMGASAWTLQENESVQGADDLSSSLNDEDDAYEGVDAAGAAWPAVVKDVPLLVIDDIVDESMDRPHEHTTKADDSDIDRSDANCQIPVKLVSYPTRSVMSILAQRRSFGDIYRRCPADSAITNVNVLAKSSSSPDLTDTQAGSLDTRLTSLSTQDVRSSGGHFQAL